MFLYKKNTVGKIFPSKDDGHEKYISSQGSILPQNFSTILVRIARLIAK